MTEKSTVEIKVNFIRIDNVMQTLKSAEIKYNGRIIWKWSRANNGPFDQKHWNSLKHALEEEDAANVFPEIQTIIIQKFNLQ